MGAMLAGPTALGGEGRELLARYVRHVGREAFRRGWWGPVETWLTLVGIGRGIVLALARR
jgi:hypothetical protein